jgi:polar amino acid transport system substrate-binding protein
MNFKTLTLLVAVILATSVLTAHFMQPSSGGGTEKQAHESAYERVMRTGILRCGYGISPPTLVRDVNSGEISGLDHDIWQVIGKELGIKIEWSEEAGWGNFIEGLRSHRYDAFCSQHWPDAARAKFMTVTDPFLYSFLYAYVRKGDARFDGNLNLANDPSIAIPAIDGDVGVSMAENFFPKAKILSLPQTSTLSDMILSVSTKKADIVFLAPAMMIDFEKTNPGVLERVKNAPPSHVFGSYYGFNQGEVALRDAVNIALRKMVDDGRLAEITARYSADYIPAQKNYPVQ